MSNEAERGIVEKIKDWKSKLADDRNSNPLLNLGKTRKAKLDLSTTASILYKNFAEDTSEGVAIEELTTQPTNKQLIKLLEKLKTGAKSTLNEKGFNSLFLVLGTLTWFDESQKKQQDEPYISPLLLVPVELKKKGKNPPEYTLSPTDEEISVNFLVANKLRDEFGINLPGNEKIQELGYEGFLDKVRNSIGNKQGWEIKETACVTLFESLKTAMIKDIEQNQQVIRNHPILQAVALKEPLKQSQITTIADTELDKINPASVYQMWDADSSQQVVIEAAKAGLSFVVQGPPGTGKSQSIANMIAELIAQGKKVALVAEKQTALEAVYKKFSSEECKLEQLCLNLHHKGTTNTKEFVAELSKTKGLLSQQNAESESQTFKRDIFFQDFTQCRQDTNSYTTNLHHKYHPINKSAFELFGELLRLETEKVPSLNFNIYNLQEWSDKRLLLEAKGLVNDLAQYNNFFQGKDEQKLQWLHSPIKEWNTEVNNDLRQNIKNLFQGIELANQTTTSLQELLRTQPASTFIDLNKLKNIVAHIVAVPSPIPKGCPQGRKLNQLEELFERLKNDNDQLQGIGSELNPKYIQEFLNWDLLQLREIQRNIQKYNGIFRWLRVGFWKIRGRLRALRQEDKKRVDYDELTADIQQAIERKEILNKLEQDNTQDYYRNFDLFFERGTPDLEAIENALKWLKELQQYPISSQAVAEIISADENLQQLRNLLLNLENSINLIQDGFKFLKKHFPQNRVTKANDWEKTNLKQVNNFIEEINKDLPNFQIFLDCQQKIKQLEAIGAKDFLSKLRQSKIPPQHWFPVLQKGVYQNWLEHIYSENPQLRTFDKKRHQQKIEEFCQLDKQQYQEAIKRLKNLHFERWKECKLKPEIITQEGILDQKSTAKRVNQKIRQFIKKVPQLATTLKPFWLMSPLAVSQYIDAEAINFDVVIFDEASQVCTEDAVPAIMRAKQVIVVGDNKQLPPSSFFKSATSGDDDDDELETYESLLDECSTVLQKFTLKWHYRSKDESLIAFSNSQFYNSELLTFPNPLKDSNRGVHFHYVENGIYARGTDRNNLAEAEVVAQIALEDFQKKQQNPDFSLGIVTLNEEQAATIREIINRLSSNNPQFEEFTKEDSKKFFIKPLEKVQGDQQEVIIMSFGYGKDENGKIIYNFGLLTKPGGRRRLNVAITRARSKFVLVSSMQSTDFESSDNTERTVLRDYFAYAQNGGEVSIDINDDLSESDFIFEEDIYQALTQRGYKVKKKVGRSAYPIDLAVINDRQQETEEFLLGIVCDGTIYHKYPTSRERNRLRKTILENLGWNIYQIWSHEWFKNPQKQINQLVNHIESLQNKK